MATLTVAKVRALKDPGRYAAGGVTGLYLVVTRTGSKNWIQRIHVQRAAS